MTLLFAFRLYEGWNSWKCVFTLGYNLQANNNNNVTYYLFCVQTSYLNHVNQLTVFLKTWLQTIDKHLLKAVFDKHYRINIIFFYITNTSIAYGMYFKVYKNNWYWVFNAFIKHSSFKNPGRPITV